MEYSQGFKVHIISIILKITIDDDDDDKFI